MKIASSLLSAILVLLQTHSQLGQSQWPSMIDLSSLQNAQLVKRDGLGLGNTISWTRDGKQILVSTSTGLQFRNSSSFEIEGKLDLRETSSHASSILPSRVWVLWRKGDGAFTGRVTLVDAGSGLVISEIAKPVAPGRRQFALLPDESKIVVNTIDGLEVYDAETAQFLAKIPSPDVSVTAFADFETAATSVTQLLAVLVQRELTVYDLRAIQSPKKRVVIGGNNDFRYLALHPSGAAAAVSDDTGRIVTIDIASGTQQELPHQHLGMVTAMIWNQSGTALASASIDGTIVIWDMLRRAQTKILNAASRQINSMAFHGDSTLATLTTNGDVTIWNSETGKRLGSTSGGLLSMRNGGFAQNPEVGLLATANGGGVTVWKIDSAERLWDFHDNHSFITSLAISSDGRYLAAASTARLFTYNTYFQVRDKPLDLVVVWDLKSGKVVYYDDTLYMGVAFSPDGKYLLACSQGGFGHLVTVALGNRKKSSLTRGCTNSMALDRSGKRIATWAGVSMLSSFVTGNDQRIYQTGLPGEGTYRTAAVTSDGTLAAHGSKGMVLVCRVSMPSGRSATVRKCPGNIDIVLQKPQSTAPFLDFSPDKTMLIAGSSSGKVIVYNLLNGSVAREIGTKNWTGVVAGFFNKTQTKIHIVRGDGIVETWEVP